MQLCIKHIFLCEPLISTEQNQLVTGKQLSSPPCLPRFPSPFHRQLVSLGACNSEGKSPSLFGQVKILLERSFNSVLIMRRPASLDILSVQATRRATNIAFVALNFGILALLTYLSAVLYQQGILFSRISIILGIGKWFRRRPSNSCRRRRVCLNSSPHVHCFLSWC
jgi:hypothetical protein